MRRLKIITGVLLLGVLFNFSTGRTVASPPLKKVTTKVEVADTIPPLTKENLKKELAKQGIPHADIVFNQAMLETGNLTSKLCRNHNNLFGIRHGKPYAHYNNWIESVSDYKKRISSRYKGGDYYQFLERIKYAVAGTYVRYLKKMA